MGKVRAVDKADDMLTLSSALQYREPFTIFDNAQYTPPTPTRLNCRVESRRRRVGGVY